MSNTPRTDSQAVRYYDDASGNRVEYIPSRFGRQLERELAEANRRACEYYLTDESVMVMESPDAVRVARKKAAKRMIDMERELAEVNEKLRQHASMLKSSDAHNNDMFCKLEKERELHSETKSELADARKQRDALAEALASLLSGVQDGWFSDGKWWHTGIEQAEQALRATKGGTSE
jgi:hypothetical protein